MKACLLIGVSLPLYLGCGGPREIDAKEALIEALQSAQTTDRLRAAREIRDLRYVHPETVPALLAALKDEDQLVRIAAAEALAELGADGQPHLNDLAAARSADGDPAVQLAIERTMFRIRKASGPPR